MADIHIFDTPDELYNAGSKRFLKAADETLRRQGRFAVALSGGSTPLPLYQQLAQDHRANGLDWDRIHFFWGDERPVEPGHPDSNYRGAFQALLDPRQIPTGNIHRVKGELEPADAARQYEAEILDWFEGNPPRFDLILLGMGDDGHTASLFPGTSVVSAAHNEQPTLVEAVLVPKLESWRITFTPRLINAAAQVLFMVIGEEKAKALKAVIEGPYQPATYPAQLVQPQDGSLTWLIDRDAALELDP